MPKIRTIADGNLIRDACPECNSPNISGDRVYAEEGVAWQTCQCNDCGYTWRDVYALVQQEPAD